MKVFVTGKNYSGKSTFVNGLFDGRTEIDGDIGHVGLKVDTFDTGSGSLTVYDTPGQELNATSHLQWIQANCSDVQIVFFCIRMNDQFRPEDQQALESLTKTFSDGIWTKVVVVLTHANQVVPANQAQVSNDEYYNGILSDMSSRIKSMLSAITDGLGLNPSIVDRIPIVPVGLPQDFSLPGGCSDWRSAVINACSTIGAPGTTLLKQVIENDSLRVSLQDTVFPQQPEPAEVSSGLVTIFRWLRDKIVGLFRNRSDGMAVPLNSTTENEQ